MKTFVSLIVPILLTLTAHAQKTNPLLFTYRQKQLNDTLKAIFPDLQKNEEAILTQNNMPVLNLLNGGVKMGENKSGDLYSMNIDKMPCLKPAETADVMPNAIRSEQLLLGMPSKRK